MSSSLSRRPRVEDLADARFGPDQVDGELGVPGRVAVADQHGHVRGDPLGAERGGGERGGHREEDHRTAPLTPTGSVASATTTRSVRPAARSAAASRSCGTTPITRLAPARLAAAADSEPLLPAAPSTATTGPRPSRSAARD